MFYVADKLAELLTELSNAPPSKLRKYIAHITNRRKLSNFTNYNGTPLVDIENVERSWSFGNALFFCVTVVTTIGSFFLQLFFLILSVSLEIFSDNNNNSSDSSNLIQG